MGAARTARYPGRVELLNRRNAVFASVTAVGFALDQATKAWIVANVAYATEEIPVIPGFLSIVHAQNFGAAFSSLEGQWALFIVFTAIATVVILDLLRRLRPDAAFTAGILGLILSGAHGNGLDRLRLGHVTDFIRVYTDMPRPKAWLIENFGTNTWPIFNVADSVLLVGVSLYLVHYLFLEEAEEAVEGKPAEEPAG